MTRRHQALSSLDDEIRDHIERETQDNIDRGLAPDEARRQAMLKFGNILLVKEDTREVWASRMIDELVRTTRVAARTWRRTPLLASAIVVTLALGIGGATTAFAIAYSLIVKSFPYPDADRLVSITSYDRRTNAGTGVSASNRLPQFAEWQKDSPSFEQLGAWSGSAPDAFTVTGDPPERVKGLRVTHQLLPMFGATPAQGRLFVHGDDTPGAAQTVVLSHAYWQRRFAERPDVIGQSITVDNRPHTVIGVLPPAFQLSGSLFSGAPIDMFLPLTVDGSQDLGGFMVVIGRIRSGVGAPGSRVIAGVLADTMTCLGFGLAAGVILSLAAASLIRSYLFGIEPNDASTLVAACATVVGAALIAAYLPARRAPHTDPTAALRVE